MNGLKPFDLCVSCRRKTDEIGPARLQEPLDFPALLNKLASAETASELVHISGFESTNEVREVLSTIKNSVRSLHIFKCPKLDDLSFVEELPNLETLNIYWNSKATKLFAAFRMPNLKKLHITDCNKLKDFSGLRIGNLEYLDLFGCNRLSSFTSKFDAGNLDFLLFMPKLKHLCLEIMKTCEDDVYLKTIAKIKTLESINIDSSFFTFEQFAWLSAQLPNVKEGLKPCTYYVSPENKGSGIVPEVDEYYVIGRHKTKVKREKAVKYTDAYNRLREEFKNAPEPPPATFTVKI